MSDIDDLIRVLNAQPGVQELEDALEGQNRQTKQDLESLFGPIPADKDFDFAIVSPPYEELQRAYQEISSLPGVNVSTFKDKLLPSVEVPVGEAMKDTIEKICKNNSWQLSDWRAILKKG